ncbi:hypothetical protein OH491_12530 [Termitidicoccus mucosus]|uniref:Cohesin domain-containing protein n=1 Tax=Termitidicoccus mucosus TaxID=1184151 RepID=A0A178IIZ4_9BACT|nr:hypothetical protein AW736_14935 [Opitutaceae bacterium TSB47]
MKTHPSILCALLFALMIIATSATTAQPTTPTKANPFDSITNRVMYSGDPVTFEDWYSLFEVHFTNLENYEYVQTEGCTILEVYNVSKNQEIGFCPSWEAYGYEEDPYMPEYCGTYFAMSHIFVTYNANNVADGDLLRIRFKVPNDAEYESPVFELYAPYSYTACLMGSQEYYWD